MALVVKKKKKTKTPCLPMQECKRLGFNPWVRKISWRRAWQPTPVSLPRESHEQRNLVGYTVLQVAKSWTQLSDFTDTSLIIYSFNLPLEHVVGLKI